jgi:hypothetical protein
MTNQLQHPIPNNPLRVCIAAAAAALVATLYSGAACAALGSLPSSWDAPNEVEKSAGYTDRTTVLPSTTTLHEYIGVDGNVFAVSWAGPTLPNFTTLLGDYAVVMHAEVHRAPVAGRGGLTISTPTFMLQSGGRAGAFSGKAWLPNRLPAGFSPLVMP